MVAVFAHPPPTRFVSCHNIPVSVIQCIRMRIIEFGNLQAHMINGTGLTFMQRSTFLGDPLPSTAQNRWVGSTHDQSWREFDPSVDGIEIFGQPCHDAVHLTAIRACPVSQSTTYIKSGLPCMVSRLALCWIGFTLSFELFPYWFSRFVLIVTQNSPLKPVLPHLTPAPAAFPVWAHPFPCPTRAAYKSGQAACGIQ